MLNRIRAVLTPGFLRLGRAVARTGLPPNFWTAVGLVFAALSGSAYAGWIPGGSIAGGLLLLVSGVWDIVDGAVARVMSQVTERGAFLDSNLDRLAEVMLFLGLIVGNHVPGWVALLALSFSLLVSYARARGEALGVRMVGVGIGERAERLVVMAVASIVGFVAAGVWLVLAMALVTFVQRVILASRVLATRRQSGAPPPPAP